MLGRFTNYIFSGLFGTPEAETTPMRYETREAAGDWLLVDMPDQAIDDENMDSDSEEDEILSAVPLLMGETVVTEQPKRVVLTYEEATVDSICDNSDEIQNSSYVEIEDDSEMETQDIYWTVSRDYDLSTLLKSSDNLFQDTCSLAKENSDDDTEEEFQDKFQDIAAEIQARPNDKTRKNCQRRIRDKRIRDKLGVKTWRDTEALFIEDALYAPASNDEMRFNFATAEENQDDSDDEIPEDRVQKYLEFAFAPRRRKAPLSESSKIRGRAIQIKSKPCSRSGPLLLTPCQTRRRYHDFECVKNPLFEHAADFQILSNSWGVHQTLHYPSKFSLAVAQCYSSTREFASTTLGPLIAVLQTETEKKETAVTKPSCTPVHREDHPAFFKHVCKLRDAARKIREAKNTALALGQVKEIKPVQEAIQYENKKYLTRSHMNRHNRNFFFQSSTKSNRRRNLQRNHSGANNNRKGTN